jgi:hypothetical protein
MPEFWLSNGFEFGNSIGFNSDDGNAYVGSPGLNLDTYTFWNEKNIGLLFHFSFLFPTIKKVYEGPNYNYQFGFLIGPGFRYNLSERLKLIFGFGFDVLVLSAYNNSTKNNDGFICGIGIGGDIGIKYDITNFVFINCGINTSFDFITYNDIRYVHDTYVILPNKLDVKYPWLTIKPYICVGINIPPKHRKF